MRLAAANPKRKRDYHYQYSNVTKENKELFNLSKLLSFLSLFCRLFLFNLSDFVVLQFAVVMTIRVIFQS